MSSINPLSNIEKESSHEEFCKSEEGLINHIKNFDHNLSKFDTTRKTAGIYQGKISHSHLATSSRKERYGELESLTRFGERIKKEEFKKSIESNNLASKGKARPATMLPNSSTLSEQNVVIRLATFRVERSIPIEEVYEFLDFLGKGTYGFVKKARHRETGQIRAVKLLSKDNQKTILNFEEELEILKTITHPNLLRFFEFFQDDYYFYMVTELCTGGDLASAITSGVELSEAEIASIMWQVISAVSYLHKRRIVHRDIKLDNILLTENKLNGTVKLIDFGRSLFLRPDEKLTERAGSLYYMSPQTVSGQMYDESCDIWSCGVTLYLLLAGRPPFWECTMEGTTKAIMENELNLTDSYWAIISKEAKNVLSRMICRDSALRITAVECLKHPFFQKKSKALESDKTKENLVLSLRNLKSFRVQTTLQRATLNYLASQELDVATERYIQSLFGQIDKDNDGLVTEQDLLEGFESLYHDKSRATRFAKLIMKRTDLNKNGVIDYNEFLMVNLECKHRLDERQLKRAFDFYDSDHNGVIRLEELQAVFGQFCTESQIEQIMREVDLKGDKAIDFDSFKALMQGVGNGHSNFNKVWSVNC